jgi:hypothetical protein
MGRRSGPRRPSRTTFRHRACCTPRSRTRPASTRVGKKVNAWLHRLTAAQPFSIGQAEFERRPVMMLRSTSTNGAASTRHAAGAHESPGRSLRPALRRSGRGYGQALGRRAVPTESGGAQLFSARGARNSVLEGVREQGGPISSVRGSRRFGSGAGNDAEHVRAPGLAAPRFCVRWSWWL